MSKKEGGKPKEPRRGKPFLVGNIRFRIDLWRDFGNRLMVQEEGGSWSDICHGSVKRLKNDVAPAIARVEREARLRGEE